MHEQPDIHARLMSVYPQVPEWWYAIIFVSMFVCGISQYTLSFWCLTLMTRCSPVSIEVWDTNFPVQYFILALVIGQ